MEEGTDTLLVVQDGQIDISAVFERFEEKLNIKNNQEVTDNGAISR